MNDSGACAYKTSQRNRTDKANSS